MTHALRLWRRQPVLALAAILSLALGIGANTAIFSVLNAVVLRPLPYHDADRLVIAWETTADNPARWVAPANFVDWSREALRMALLLGGPPLGVALAVGLLIGIAQTLTQLHEPVVGQVPRLIAVVLVTLLALPWLVGRWVTFAVGLIASIPDRL